MTADVVIPAVVLVAIVAFLAVAVVVPLCRDLNDEYRRNNPPRRTETRRRCRICDHEYGDHTEFLVGEPCLACDCPGYLPGDHLTPGAYSGPNLITSVTRRDQPARFHPITFADAEALTPDEATAILDT